MKDKLLSMAILLITVLCLSGCTKAVDYDKAGKAFYKTGNYEKAAESFKAAISSNPNRADYYIDYGMTLLQLTEYEAAITQFDQAYSDKDMLIIRENNKRALRGKGIAYYDLMQYEKAIEQFELALRIDELSNLDMDILYYMADSLQNTGSYDKAIKAYTKILKADKKNTLAYSKRALSYKCMGDYEKSLADYNSAITLEPNNYEHYIGKYYLMSDNGDKAGAKEVLGQVEKITAASKEDQYNLARVHFFEENYETALTELTTAAADGIAEANYYTGEIYRIQKDYEKAAYYYELYVNDCSPVSSNVYNQIAVCMIKTGDYEKARKYLEQGLAYNYAGTLKTMRKNEIVVYEKLGRYEEAKEKLNAYLASYPDDNEAKREAIFIENRALN